MSIIPVNINSRPSLLLAKFPTPPLQNLNQHTWLSNVRSLKFETSSTLTSAIFQIPNVEENHGLSKFSISDPSGIVRFNIYFETIYTKPKYIDLIDTVDDPHIEVLPAAVRLYTASNCFKKIRLNSLDDTNTYLLSSKIFKSDTFEIPLPPEYTSIVELASYNQYLISPVTNDSYQLIVIIPILPFSSLALVQQCGDDLVKFNEFVSLANFLSNSKPTTSYVENFLHMLSPFQDPNINLVETLNTNPVTRVFSFFDYPPATYNFYFKSLLTPITLMDNTSVSLFTADKSHALFMVKYKRYDKNFVLNFKNGNSGWEKETSFGSEIPPDTPYSISVTLKQESGSHTLIDVVVTSHGFKDTIQHSVSRYVPTEILATYFRNECVLQVVYPTTDVVISCSSSETPVNFVTKTNNILLNTFCYSGSFRFSTSNIQNKLQKSINSETSVFNSAFGNAIASSICEFKNQHSDADTYFSRVKEIITLLEYSKSSSSFTVDEVFNWKNYGPSLMYFFFSNFPDVMNATPSNSPDYATLCLESLRNVVLSHLPKETDFSSFVSTVNSILQINTTQQTSSSAVINKIQNELKLINAKLENLTFALSQVVVINPIKPPTIAKTIDSAYLLDYQNEHYPCPYLRLRLPFHLLNNVNSAFCVSDVYDTNQRTIGFYTYGEHLNHKRYVVIFDSNQSYSCFEEGNGSQFTGSYIVSNPMLATMSPVAIKLRGLNFILLTVEVLDWSMLACARVLYCLDEPLDLV